MDVEITVDMLGLAPHVDHVVLFSGDGDLTRLVTAVQEKGVRVSVVSTVKNLAAHDRGRVAAGRGYVHPSWLIWPSLWGVRRDSHRCRWLRQAPAGHDEDDDEED